MNRQLVIEGIRSGQIDFRVIYDEYCDDTEVILEGLKINVDNYHLIVYFNKSILDYILSNINEIQKWTHSGRTIISKVIELNDRELALKCLKIISYDMKLVSSKIIKHFFAKDKEVIIGLIEFFKKFGVKFRHQIKKIFRAIDLWYDLDFISDYASKYLSNLSHYIPMFLQQDYHYIYQLAKKIKYPNNRNLFSNFVMDDQFAIMLIDYDCRNINHILRQNSKWTKMILYVINKYPIKKDGNWLIDAVRDDVIIELDIYYIKWMSRYQKDKWQQALMELYKKELIEKMKFTGNEISFHYE